MNKTLQQITTAALDLVYPRDCLVCMEPVTTSQPRYLCRSCIADFPFVRAPFCNTCGNPFDGVVEGKRDCPACKELEPHFQEGRTLALLQDGIHDLIIEIKYHGGVHLLPDVALLVGESPQMLEFLHGAVLVPVPLHPSRFRYRGFNQSEEIARQMAKAAGGLPVQNLLRRIRPTETQTRKTRKERAANVKNAFALDENAAIVPSKRYILVDDVFTTGATLNACAKELRKAGAERIDVVSLGHG